MSDARLYESLSGRKDINAIRRALQTSALDTRRLAPRHHHLKNILLCSFHTHTYHHNSQCLAPTKHARRSIPKISPHRPHRRNIHTQLVTAAETVGFLGLINHDISPEESEHMFSTSASFFICPIPQKPLSDSQLSTPTGRRTHKPDLTEDNPIQKRPIRCNSGPT
jgi:hypothetical protein